ncbi:MAG: HAD hydrolase family protein [Phycisphaerae bacterium]|nr:HAD hydrolase family protein [Phycisphaerae bacterium]
MSYRLIGLDLDGTLLSPDGKVSARSREAVQGVLSAGAEVCFATGRNWNESRSVFTATGHLDWAVVVGGAVVMDAAAGRIVHRRPMDGTLAAEVCAAFESVGQPAMALQDHEKSDVDYFISSEGGMKSRNRDVDEMDQDDVESCADAGHQAARSHASDQYRGGATRNGEVAGKADGSVRLSNRVPLHCCARAVG